MYNVASKRHQQKGNSMFYFPDYKSYAEECITNGAATADEYDLDQIANELDEALDGASPDEMDFDEFWEIVARNEL